MNAAFERITAATGARTQVQLAELLEIRQSSISDAKRRQSIPDAWLVALLKKFNLNPDWILTGQGERYLVPAGMAPSMAQLPENPAAGTPLEQVLQNIIEAVTMAREKHSFLGRSVEQARRAVEAEHKEWEAQSLLIENFDGSINHVRLEKSHKESMDCISTHVRFLIGDFIGL